jgi:hypothetical protein
MKSKILAKFITKSKRFVFGASSDKLGEVSTRGGDEIRANPVRDPFGVNYTAHDLPADPPGNPIAALHLSISPDEESASSDDERSDAEASSLILALTRSDVDNTSDPSPSNLVEPSNNRCKAVATPDISPASSTQMSAENPANTSLALQAATEASIEWTSTSTPYQPGSTDETSSTSMKTPAKTPLHASELQMPPEMPPEELISTPMLHGAGTTNTIPSTSSVTTSKEHQVNPSVESSDSQTAEEESASTVETPEPVPKSVTIKKKTIFPLSPRIHNALERIRGTGRRQNQLSDGSSNSSVVERVDVDDLFSRYNEIVKDMQVLHESRVKRVQNLPKSLSVIDDSDLVDSREQPQIKQSPQDSNVDSHEQPQSQSKHDSNVASHEQPQIKQESPPKHDSNVDSHEQPQIKQERPNEQPQTEQSPKHDSNVIDVSDVVDLHEESRLQLPRRNSGIRKRRPIRRNDMHPIYCRSSSCSSDSSNPSEMARNLRQQLDQALKTSAAIRNTQELLGVELSTFKNKLQQQRRSMSPARRPQLDSPSSARQGESSEPSYQELGHEVAGNAELRIASPSLDTTMESFDRITRTRKAMSHSSPPHVETTDRVSIARNSTQTNENSAPSDASSPSPRSIKLVGGRRARALRNPSAAAQATKQGGNDHGTGRALIDDNSSTEDDVFDFESSEDDERFDQAALDANASEVKLQQLHKIIVGLSKREELELAYTIDTSTTS